MAPGIRRIPAQARLLILLLAAGSAWAQNCPEVDLNAQKQQEAACRAQNGEWSRFGVHAHLCNIYSCAPRTKDGGKPCRSSGECEYQCVSKKELPIGTAVLGECAAIASPWGCHYPVEGGLVAGRICVD